MKTLLVATPTVVLLGCQRPDTELIEYVTFGVGLPRNSTIVATKRDPESHIDGRSYLNFDTDFNGVSSFARQYTGGSLDSMKHSRTELKGATSQGTWIDTVEGIPWDLATISNGRYSRHEATNGLLPIDLDRNRVYVLR